MSNKKICCLCGKEFEGHSNNPYPLMASDKKCCDDCNSRYVITLREIYFPVGYSDDYVLFNHTPSAKDLEDLVRCTKSFFWLDDTLTNAKRERELEQKCVAAKTSLKDHDSSDNDKDSVNSK